MNQQALEEAAKAIAAVGHTDPPSWCDYNPAEKSVLITTARAALTAYAEACGERVVATNGTGEEEYVRVLMHEDETLAPGEILVIRKAGT